MTNENMTAGFNTEETLYEGIDTSECEVIGMQVEDITKDEVMYYLEDAVHSGTANEIEEKVYYDIKWSGKCKKWELDVVKANMIEMYGEKF